MTVAAVTAMAKAAAAVAAMATAMAAVAAMATAMVAMTSATAAVAVVAITTSMVGMATAMAAVAAMATAMAAVTTINSKEAATVAAEELDDGLDRWLAVQCIFLFLFFLTIPTNQGNREVSSLEVHPGLVVLVAVLDAPSLLAALFLSFSDAFTVAVAVSVAITVTTTVPSLLYIQRKWTTAGQWPHRKC